MVVPYRTRSTRLFASPDDLEEAVRIGAQALVLQWLTLFRAIGILRALIEACTAAYNEGAPAWLSGTPQPNSHAR